MPGQIQDFVLSVHKILVFSHIFSRIEEVIRLNRQDKVGMLASSLAGHDKNKVYLIVKEEGDCFWLADGKTRSLGNPKKKKQKHVQLIKYYTDRKLMEGFWQGKGFSDLEIKRAIKAYETVRREKDK